MRKPITLSTALHAIAAATVVFAAAIWQPTQTRADEPLRVGKAVPEAFSFVPLDIGIQEGIFKKNGVDVQASAMAGDAKLQQAMAADSIDAALGSGPGMAF